MPVERVGKEKAEYFTVDASIICGNSGGPVINKRGHVVGMIEWGVDSENARYAKVQNGFLKGKYIQEEIELLESINYFKNIDV